jgi:hypothetical protein
MEQEPDRQIGESRTSFADAAHNAAHELGTRLGDERAEGTWTANHFEVDIRHESPAHIQVYRVTLERQ